MYQLKRHFDACELPVVFMAEDPRPQSEIETQPEPWNAIYMDRAVDREIGEHFRIFKAKNAVLYLRHKQPKTRHILLQTRIWMPPVEENERVYVDTYLLGHDERQLFIVPVSNAATSVNSALSWLGPTGAKRRVQLKRGRKVIRQGDWFFEPLGSNFTPTLSSNAPLFRNEPLGVRSHWAVETKHQHIAQEQVLSGTWTRFGRSFPVFGIFVRGSIRHPEHNTVKLNGWYRAVQKGHARNIGRNPALGYYD